MWNGWIQHKTYKPKLTFLEFDIECLYISEPDTLLTCDPGIGFLHDVTEHFITSILLVTLIVLRHKVLVTCKRIYYLKA